jgi:cell division protease FtsH
MSGDASRLVDMEIDQLVDLCYKEALGILSTNCRQLELLKDKLIEEEIVDGDWVYELVTGKCKIGRSVELDSLDFD